LHHPLIHPQRRTEPEPSNPWLPVGNSHGHRWGMLMALDNLGEALVNVQPNGPHRSPPTSWETPPSNTTPTDPRSWRNRVGRRGGQISDRTRGPYSRRPARDWCPRWCPCPGGCSLPALAPELAHGFHTRYQRDDPRCFLTSPALPALAPDDKDFHIRPLQ